MLLFSYLILRNIMIHLRLWLNTRRRGPSILLTNTSTKDHLNCPAYTLVSSLNMN